MTKRISIIGTTNSTVGQYPTWRDDEAQAFERDFLVAGVIQGIGSTFTVSQRGAGANMSVDVASGRALVNITNTNLTPNKTYNVWFDSDATTNVNISAADPTNPRIDIICLKVDVSQNPDAGAGNIASIIAVAGTPAGSPAVPSTPANCLKLAQVAVAASAVSIVTGNITDYRTYTTVKTAVLQDLARQTDVTTLRNDLASTANAKGASLIGIEDLNGVLTATTVEAALYELKTSPGADARFGTGADGALSVTSGTTTIDLGSANVVVKNYTSINVANGATLAFSNPASDGTIVIFRCQGNVTFAGTVDMRNLGSSGGVAVTASTSAVSNGATSGNAGTNAYNNFGQTRNGGGGISDRTGTTSKATGGGGGANISNNGNPSTASSPAIAATAGTSITTGIAAAIEGGLLFAPGAGGGSGAVAYNLSTYSSGTFIVTSGYGGRGAGSLLVTCGGNYSDAGGTIDLSGSNGGAGTQSTGSSSQYSLAASGGGGGAGGNYTALVKGTINQSGTKTVTGGSGGGAVSSSVGDVGGATSGGSGASGFSCVVPII